MRAAAPGGSWLGLPAGWLRQWLLGRTLHAASRVSATSAPRCSAASSTQAAQPAFGVHMYASVPLAQSGKARYAPQLSADCKVNYLLIVRLRTALH